MGFISWIIEDFNNASAYFYSIYLEILDWPWPLWLAANLFYYLSRVFNWLAWDFFHFYEWASQIEAQVALIYSWEDIQALLLWWWPNLDEVVAWFYQWWSNVYDVVAIWWSSTKYTVLAWIEEAKQWALLLINSLQDQVTTLGVRIDDLLAMLPDLSGILAWFTNWTGNVSQVINNWWTGALTEVQDLINSAFIIREDYWRGWQKWRSEVAEFFSDPEDWLYKSLDRIIERFW